MSILDTYLSDSYQQQGPLHQRESRRQIVSRLSLLHTVYEASRGISYITIPRLHSAAPATTLANLDRAEQTQRGASHVACRRRRASRSHTSVRCGGRAVRRVSTADVRERVGKRTLNVSSGDRADQITRFASIFRFGVGLTTSNSTASKSRARQFQRSTRADSTGQRAPTSYGVYGSASLSTDKHRDLPSGDPRESRKASTKLEETGVETARHNSIKDVDSAHIRRVADDDDSAQHAERHRSYVRRLRVAFKNVVTDGRCNDRPTQRVTWRHSRKLAAPP